MSLDVPNAPARPILVAGLRLRALVGEGGEGEVWDARDALGNRRALKLIRPDSLVPPAEVQRRGAWLLRIDHPALVSVRRTGLLLGGGVDGWAFVEMDFVDGTSLRDAPADPGALERLTELADALDRLHAGEWSDGVPLVHRDVKPANLIASTAGRLVLVDHSTLRTVDQLTMTMIGTPVFVAPEVQGGRSGPSADVYSFAVTALALLSGARRGQLAELVGVPEELDVPNGLRAALSADPLARPRSCADVLTADTVLVLPRRREAFASAEARPAEARSADHQSSRRREAFASADGLTGEARSADHQSSRRREAFASADGLTGEARSADHQRTVEEWTDSQVGWPTGDDFVSVPPPPSAPADEAWVAWEAAAEEDSYPGWKAAFEPVARRSLAGPLLVLALLLGVAPVVEWLGLPPWPHVAAVAGAAAALHLVVQLAGDRGWMGLLLPPVAWAFLLADRASAVPGRLRDWSRPLLTGALALATLAVLSPVAELGLTPDAWIAATAAGWLVAVLAALVARDGGVIARLALSPLWLLGAALLLVGSLVLLPFSALAGRGGAAGRLLGGTLTGVAAFVNPRRPYRRR